MDKKTEQERKAANAVKEEFDDMMPLDIKIIDKIELMEPDTDVDS